jgi:hypothetical protein
MSQLARDDRISVSTAYDYRDEAISVLAARRPGLHGALLAAKGAVGHGHVILDGTLIPADRSCRPSPTPGVAGRESGTRRLPDVADPPDHLRLLVTQTSRSRWGLNKFASQTERYGSRGRNLMGVCSVAGCQRM